MIKSILDKQTTYEFQKAIMNNIHHVINVDLNHYVQFSNQSYKNNLIFENHEMKIELVCWLKGQETKYHTHPKNGCLFITLLGCFQEQFNNELNYIYPFEINYRKNNDVHKLTAMENSICLHFCSPSLQCVRKSL
jgi:quercetin dioxygenase-like cupin family protein